MASQANLFGDSSSEDEEDSDLNLSSPKKDTPSRTIIKEDPDEDDDDDDDDDDELMKDAVEEKPTEEEKAKEGEEKEDAKSIKTALDDSDEDDDGDAEFDDGGAVTGSSAPTPKDIAEDDEQALDGAAVSAKKSSKPPQNATVLDVERPATNVSLHMTKLPNLVGIQTAAFDKDVYDEKEEEEQYKGYVHNMIRWRYKRDENGDRVRDDDGSLIRESNSKLVKWSDGSFTLHIGNEAFDVQAIDSSTNGFAGLNGYVYVSQKATFSNDGEEEETPGGTVLECIGPVTSRLVAKPSSLQSEAHKSLTVAVRQKTLKKARIGQYVTQEDPEKAKEERIRYNQDAEKIQSRKRANNQYRSTASRHRTPGMNRSYLEEDDDVYDNTNLGALKKRSLMDDDMSDDYGDSDADDDYEETFGNRNRKRQKNAEEDEDDDDEGELVFGDEDEDEEGIQIKAPKKKRPHQAVLEDDDDDE